jgi:hypothetical protein
LVSDELEISCPEALNDLRFVFDPLSISFRREGFKNSGARGTHKRQQDERTQSSSKTIHFVGAKVLHGQNYKIDQSRIILLYTAKERVTRLGNASLSPKKEHW